MTTQKQPRTFEARPAVRERTPILVGLVGPSGTGKTFSALRLAAGFQRVTGGDTYLIDTEARRALHYAEKFKFVHVPFGAPFSPLDYLEVLEFCVKRGASTIVVDSMSHEHEGPGGVLEWHEREMGGDFKKQMIAWGKPKAARRRLINAILQMSCNFIFNFRAKKKLKIVKGKEPEVRGFMPIAGEEFIYEMTLKCLLLPGANGVPTWQPEEEDERAMVKLPEQFRSMFYTQTPPQLTEDIGQQLATWGAGAAAPAPMPLAELVAGYERCTDPATFRTLEDARRAAWGGYSKADKAVAKSAADATQKAIEEAAKAPPPEIDVPLPTEGTAQDLRDVADSLGAPPASMRDDAQEPAA